MLSPLCSDLKPTAANPVVSRRASRFNVCSGRSARKRPVGPETIPPENSCASKDSELHHPPARNPARTWRKGSVCMHLDPVQHQPRTASMPRKSCASRKIREAMKTARVILSKKRQGDGYPPDERHDSDPSAPFRARENGSQIVVVGVVVVCHGCSVKSGSPAGFEHVLGRL